MTKLTINVQDLRDTLRNIDLDLPDRSVCNEDQLQDLNNKLYDLIVSLDYNVDIGDCLSMLNQTFENLEMYD